MTKPANYAIACVTPLPYEQAEQQVRAELSKEGFGVLTEIDVAATLKLKLGVDMAPYKILGACAPQLAHQGLQAEPAIGLLLPCNVVVREHAGQILVEALDPVAQLSVADNERLEPLAQEARARLERVIDALPRA